MFSDMGFHADRDRGPHRGEMGETYTKKIQIEGRVLGDLAMNHIVPTAFEIRSHAAGQGVQDVADRRRSERLVRHRLIKMIQRHTAAIQNGVSSDRRPQGRQQDRRRTERRRSATTTP